MLVRAKTNSASSEVWALAQVEQYYSMDGLLPLPINAIPGLKYLPPTNTLAYFRLTFIDKWKRFYWIHTLGYSVRSFDTEQKTNAYFENV